MSGIFRINYIFYIRSAYVLELSGSIDICHVSSEKCQNKATCVEQFYYCYIHVCNVKLTEQRIQTFTRKLHINVT